MRGWWLNLILFLITLSICLFVSELLLRTKKGSLNDPSFYTVDPIRGWALRPGAQGWQKKEGKVYVRISSQGLRDREYKLSKPEDTIRIAVLGDSCTEALQVSRDKTFLAIAEDQLASCPSLQGKTVQLMNFGVKGYGTAQQLLTLKHHVWKYQPDMVALAFFSGNDIFNNHPSLNPMMAEHAPYYVVNPEDGKLVIKQAFGDTTWLADALIKWKKTWTSLSRRSSVLRLFNQGVDKLHESRLQGRKAEWRKALGEDYLLWLAAAPPRIPEMNQAWHVTERLISLTNREVLRNRAEFLLVLLSTPLQVHPDPWFRRRYMQQFGLPSLYYADNRIKDFARKERIRVLALAKPLLAYAEKNSVALHGFSNLVTGFGHWNEEGHKVAGRMIAADICQRFGEQLSLRSSKSSSQFHRE